MEPAAQNDMEDERNFMLRCDSSALSIFEKSPPSSSELLPLVDPKKRERLEQRLTGGGSQASFSLGTYVPMDGDNGSSIEHDFLEDDQFGTTPTTPQSRKRFTKTEDEKIIEGHEKMGDDWDAIRQTYGLDRTSSQIRSRYKRVLSKKRPLEHATTKDTEEPSAKVRKLQKLQDKSGAVALQPIVPVTRDERPLSSEETEVRRLQKTCDVLRADKEATESLKAELEIKVEEQRLQLQRAAEYERKACEVITELLRQRVRDERPRIRERVMKNCVRLGQVSYERHGANVVEVWQDGYEFREVKRKQGALVARRAQLEADRKKLKHKLKLLRPKPPPAAPVFAVPLPATAPANAAAAPPPSPPPPSSASATQDPSADSAAHELALDYGPYTEEILLQQDEILKTHLAAIKKEEADLAHALEKLTLEKALHIKELKRLSDEDKSRFNDNRVLKGRYLLLSMLGKGGFSEVYHAYDLREMREVAVKIHQANSQWNEQKKRNYTKHAVREYDIQKSLDHPRVVKLFDVFEIDQDSFCTVLEYCNGGDLDTHLKLHKTLPEKEARAIIIQIFSGLKYLNSQKRAIIHYDLKPGNILFSEGGVKITDFGLSKIMEENSDGLELTSQGAGTYWYLPPECFEINGKAPPKISSKVDVWSAGVIFYQMVFGKKPFGHNLSQTKILADHVISRSTVVEFPTKPVVSQEAKDFIKRCLITDQNERPDVMAIADDPYLKLKTKKDK